MWQRNNISVVSSKTFVRSLQQLYSQVYLHDDYKVEIHSNYKQPHSFTLILTDVFSRSAVINLSYFEVMLHCSKLMCRNSVQFLHLKKNKKNILNETLATLV